MNNIYIKRNIGQKGLKLSLFALGSNYQLIRITKHRIVSHTQGRDCGRFVNRVVKLGIYVFLMCTRLKRKDKSLLSIVKDAEIKMKELTTKDI